jgi:hypothetical protein
MSKASAEERLPPDRVPARGAVLVSLRAVLTGLLATLNWLVEEKGIVLLVRIPFQPLPRRKQTLP